MSITARLLTLLAVIYFVPGCSTATTTPQASRSAAAAAMLPPADALTLSPHKIVGRIVAVDTARGFAFVSLTTTTPAAALVEGGELIVRSDDLRETGRVRTSRYTRGRTLGTQIISGQPKLGDEVVFHAK
jgi:hypothetical protein